MLMGVHTNQIVANRRRHSTALAGLGGALYASLYSLEVSMGSSYPQRCRRRRSSPALGTVMGSLVGGVLLGVRKRFARILHKHLRRLRSDILILILLLRPAGLFGAKRSGQELLWLPLFALPLVLHNEVALTILVFTFILGMLAVSFNLIFGYTGRCQMFTQQPLASALPLNCR